MADNDMASASGTGLSPSVQPASGLSGSAASIPDAWPVVEWEDGYPLAEQDDFGAWDALPLNFYCAAEFLARELPEAASNCCAWCRVTEAESDVTERPVRLIEFSTGGWSGAESLIGFIESRLDTRHFKLSWRRGGHYVFEIPSHFLAQAIEARRAATLGAVHESAVTASDAPTSMRRVRDCDPQGANEHV